MNAHRMTAVAVGALFITASVTAVIGGTLVLPIEDGLDAAVGAQGEIAVGILLELVLVLSVVGIAVLLYPVLRPHGEGLALGYVAMRILESGLLLAAAMGARVALGVSVAGGSPQDETSAAVALAIREWTYITGSLLMLGVSAIILYTLLWRSRLVPAWLSLWGLAGGVLILARGVAAVGGLEMAGEMQALFAAPIGLQEMVLAVWLIVRGFDPRGLPADVEPLAAAGRPSAVAVPGR